MKNRISSLDIKREVVALQEDEMREFHDLFVHLHSMARVHTSMNWKKARMNLVREGDADSKFFHYIMSRKQRRDSIHLVHVDDVLVEGVQKIRTDVFNHFSSQYLILVHAIWCVLFLWKR